MKSIDEVEELAVLKEFLHNLHLAYSLGNSEKVREGLNLISQWSWSHRAGNVTLNGEEIELLLAQSLENFKSY